MTELQTISKDAFSRFGKVLEFPADNKEPFHIILTEENNPWRIAVFRYTNKEITVVENHPTSMESFEPLTGITVLVVAENETPDNFRCFLLNKPICLYKGIWHQVLSLTPEAQVKITENLEVGSEFYTYPSPLRVVLAPKPMNPDME